MRVDVVLLPQEIEGRDLSGCIVVVIDVLRATTTIATAIANGCDQIIPASSVEEAMDIVRSLGRDTFLLGGERKGLKIEGFDLGNSPLEYEQERVAGKKIVFATTNGTRIIRTVQGAASVLIGSFLNLESVCERCLSLSATFEANEANNEANNIVLVCAGREGRFSLEDALCAGMMVEWLGRIGRRMGINIEESDSAFAVRKLGEAVGKDILGVISRSDHGEYIASIGFEADLAACARLNVLKEVPQLYEGQVIRGFAGCHESLASQTAS